MRRESCRPDGTFSSGRGKAIECDAECRIVEIGDATFEMIPERVLVRAALIAAARMLGDG